MGQKYIESLVEGQKYVVKGFVTLKKFRENILTKK